MAVSTTTNRVSYAGNGVTVVFSFPEYLIQAADLKVIQRSALGVETLKVLNTDYTLAFIGAAVNGVYPGGANITMLVAPPAGSYLILYRDPAATQSTHWTDNDPMPASSLENTVDKAVLLIQRLKDQVSRGILLSEGYVASFNPTMPKVIPADSALVTNPAGDGFLFVPTASFTGIQGPVGPQGPAGVNGTSSLVVNPISTTTLLAAASPVNMQYIPCNAGAGAFNANLPQALVGIVGQVFHIKKIDSTANIVTVAAFAGDAILGTSSVTTMSLDYQGKALSFVCRAVGVWDVI